MKGSLAWEVVQVAGEHHRTRLRQPHQQALVPWRMAGCEDQHHRSVAEYVMIALDQRGLAVFERRVFVWMNVRGQPRAEHIIPLRLLSDPCGSGVVIGV